MSPGRGRGGGCGATVVFLVVLVAALLVAIDFAARRVAEDALVLRIRGAVPEASGASAHIGSFPFLPGAVTSGRVGPVETEVRDITIKRVRFDFVALELQGVRVDRDQWVNRRKVTLRHIDRGQVRGEVSQEALSEVLGVALRLEAGRAEVRVGGVSVGASLAVTEGRLVVRGLGVSLPALDLTGPFLPCVADALILDGRVALACDFTEIPPGLL